MKQISDDEMALARVGIIALIDEATGYQKERFKDKTALKKILDKERKKQGREN